MKKHATIRVAFASLLAVALLSMPAITAADVVGYWRMETDNDSHPFRASIPNEIQRGSPLISGEARIDTLNVPIEPVSWTDSANLGSLDPTHVGSVAGINATIAEYQDLNVDSITVEFWCRTLEHTGSLVTRTSGSTGFEIFSFDDVQVRYFVGNGTEVLLHPNTSDRINLDEAWVHLAWTYDAEDGVGRLYADGELRAEHDGPNGRALVWASGDMRVGSSMDGRELPVITDGLFDELRISDETLHPSDFLNARDPSPLADIDCAVADSGIIYVEDDAPFDLSDPVEDGTAEHPFDTIQEGIDAACEGATVFVRGGTYYENIQFRGRNIHVTSFDPNMTGPHSYPVIDGGYSGPVVTFNHFEDPNCRLSGFVLTGGFGEPPSSLVSNTAFGAASAIACLNASPTISHCVIVGNRCPEPVRTSAPGGIVYCVNSNAIFEHCTIVDNFAGAGGAGLYFLLSEATIPCSCIKTESLTWEEDVYTGFSCVFALLPISRRFHPWCIPEDYFSEVDAAQQTCTRISKMSRSL